MENLLITSKELYQILGQEDLVLLDASRKRDTDLSIKGAIHFDIKNKFSDPGNMLPNSFPSEKYFQEQCREIGINQNSRIVVFDNEGVFMSPRAWFLFKAFGHENVAILDGGLPDWEKFNYPLESLKGPNLIGDFKAFLNTSMITSYNEVVSNIVTKDCLLIDARSSGRFLGIDPEPRPHLKSGHINNAINLPYTEVLEGGKFKNVASLKEIFSSLDIEKDKPIIFSCGSGITACIILIAFKCVSDHFFSIYDGSWTEWAEKNKIFS